MKKIDTSKEAYEKMGIILTDEQYNDLFVANCVMKTGYYVHGILLVLKTLGLIPNKKII